MSGAKKKGPAKRDAKKPVENAKRGTTAKLDKRDPRSKPEEPTHSREAVSRAIAEAVAAAPTAVRAKAKSPVKAPPAPAKEDVEAASEDESSDEPEVELDTVEAEAPNDTPDVSPPAVAERIREL